MIQTALCLAVPPNCPSPRPHCLFLPEVLVWYLTVLVSFWIQ